MAKHDKPRFQDLSLTDVSARHPSDRTKRLLRVPLQYDGVERSQNFDTVRRTNFADVARSLRPRTKPDFDIEGAVLSHFRGAEASIRRFRPKRAMLSLPEAAAAAESSALPARATPPEGYLASSPDLPLKPETRTNDALQRVD
jgi:hypothetical protein